MIKERYEEEGLSQKFTHAKCQHGQIYNARIMFTSSNKFFNRSKFTQNHMFAKDDYYHIVSAATLRTLWMLLWPRLGINRTKSSTTISL